MTNETKKGRWGSVMMFAEAACVCAALAVVCAIAGQSNAWLIVFGRPGARRGR